MYSVRADPLTWGQIISHMHKHNNTHTHTILQHVLVLTEGVIAKSGEQSAYDLFLILVFF